MAERDKSIPIRAAGIDAHPDGLHEEIVCYTVVSGRGRALVRHLRDQKSRDFAHRLVASYRAAEDIRLLVEEFDGTEWLDRHDRRRGRAELVRAIRKVVSGIPRQ